jgi:UDP-N-acetylmuramoylalanine--D-glutamate ligase
VSGPGATLVLGAGRETRALLAMLAADEPGARVVLLDEHDPGAVEDHGLALTVVAPVDLDDATAVRRALEEAGAASVDGLVAIVRSPGVSPYRAGIAALVARLPTTTPTGRWLARHRPDDAVIISGTKGKSTTSALVAHLLAAAGRRVTLVGNIGVPLAALDAAAPRDDLVIELSSYQLADLTMPEPAAVGVLTALFVDHVPWHGSVERYHADKLRLLDLARVRIVSRQAAASGAADGRHERIAPAADDAVVAALARAGMRAPHEADAAMLALEVVRERAPDADHDALVEALARFQPLPHRLRPIGSVEGRRYVDDSISTVPEATLAALATHRADGPVTLLIGGDDRGQPLDALVAAVAGDPEVRVVLLPPLGTRLAAALAEAGVPVGALDARASEVGDLAEAVGRAHALTPPGGSVVLSPAAPSFGAFRDHVERAERFHAEVERLAERLGATLVAPERPAG